MRAVTFRTAPALVTVGVRATGLIAIQKVRADIVRAAARIALEIVIAGVLGHFLPVQALRGVYTRIVGTAVGRIDAVVIEGAEDLARGHDQTGWRLAC